jgi:hypothetical protein
VGLQQLYLHGVQLIRYSDAHAYPQTNCDAYADTNSDAYTYSRSNSDSNAETNCNSNSDSNANANTKPDADAHAHTQWGCGNVEPDTGINLYLVNGDFYMERR